MSYASLLRKIISNPQKVRKHLKNGALMFFAPIVKGYCSFPFLINISVNRICNMSCKMCDVGQGKKGSFFYKNMVPSKDRDLEIDEWKKLIDEVALFSPEISVSTTEPLLYKELPSLINHIKSKRLVCEVTTNGLLLEKCAGELVESGLDRLNISIDGPLEIHDYIRGRAGLFEEILSGIRKVHSLKEKYHIDHPEIKVFYTISNLNHSHLCETYEILEKFPISSITYQHLGFVNSEMARNHNRCFPKYKLTTTSVGDVDPRKVDIKVLDQEITALKRLKRSLEVKWYPGIEGEKLRVYYHTEGFIQRKTCRIPWTVAQINCVGDVTPIQRCFHLDFGNIRQKPFMDIWNSKGFRNFREDVSKVGAFPACSKCCALYL